MPSKDDPFRKLLHNRHCLGIVSLGSIYEKTNTTGISTNSKSFALLQTKPKCPNV